MYKLKEGPKFYNLLRKKTSFTMVRQNRQAREILSNKSFYKI